MSLLNQNNNKGKKKGKKNQPGGPGANSKFIPKQTTSAGFKSKQKNTGAQRGS